MAIFCALTPIMARWKCWSMRRNLRPVRQLSPTFQPTPPALAAICLPPSAPSSAPPMPVPAFSEGVIAPRIAGGTYCWKRLVVVARHAHGLHHMLIFGRALEHHALIKLRHQIALDLLPGRLAYRRFETAILFQLRAALLQFGVGKHDIGAALAKIDADTIAGSQQGQPAN